MHRMPKPVRTPLAVGASQWMDLEKPVQPNLMRRKIMG